MRAPTAVVAPGQTITLSRSSSASQVSSPPHHLPSVLLGPRVGVPAGAPLHWRTRAGSRPRHPGGWVPVLQVAWGRHLALCGLCFLLVPRQPHGHRSFHPLLPTAHPLLLASQ